MKYDFTLYLVTDRDLMSTHTLKEAVEQAILGGCTMIQLREKEATSLDFYNQAMELRLLTAHYHIPLIINDRVDIALSVNADGVHIGQSDIPANIVKKIVGDNMLLGVSATSIQEAIRAEEDGADYLGVGAMFPTGTKKDAQTVSKNELKQICKAVSIPVVAIGGINAQNASLLAGTGISGLAIVSAIISQPDIKQAAKSLKQSFLQGREFANEF